MDAQDIRKNLEAEYDIPFEVQSTFDGGEPAYIIGPEDTGKELFTIRVYFRNKIRLHMDFVPQKYSAEFIRAMAGQSEEDRRRFFDYASILADMGAKVDISVNGSKLDSGNPSIWPENWRDFRVHVTKMPVVEDGDLNYPEAASTWGSLLVGMILSLTDIVPVEEEPVPDHEAGYAEGSVQRTEINRYERNPLNRKLCLAAKGYDCAICGMNFEKQYGEIGYHFIHVHHIVPVSRVGAGYVIDPLRDLIPVCPNCHAMLHKNNPPLLPDELKRMIQ